MPTLRFDVNDPGLRDAFLRHEILGALAALDPHTPSRWGGMSARQMVEHLEWSVELSTGRARVECSVPEEQREHMKAFLYKSRPMPRDFMNPALVEGLPALRYGSLAEAVDALDAELERFLASDPAAVHVHPVFGPLGFEAWARSHYKHGHHHLLQFGLIDRQP